jgi:acetate---CoA ligase (ADP-forming)
MSNGVAVVGASDNNLWATHVRRSLSAFGYQGQTWLVNPNSPTVAGEPTFAALADVPGDLDAVVIAVSASRCAEVAAQAVAQGAADLVVVSDGFTESDPDGPGAEYERQLVAACRPETRLYGPNCVGFADFARSLCVIAEPIPVGHAPGNVSIVSQSGALLSTAMAAILEDGGGLDWCASVGNAAHFDVGRAIAYACDRETTKVVCVYAESLGTHPDVLRAALRRARERDVTVVMLKAGRSPAAARIAMTHTASVAGNDAEVEAFLRAYGVVRVDSFEEMARVAVLAPMRRSDRPDGVVIIGSSGGQAALATELAARENLNLAQLTPDTAGQVRAAAAPGSFLENPFDLVTRPGGKTSLADIYATVFADSNVGFALAPVNVIFPDDSEPRRAHRAAIEMVTAVASATGTPTIISSLAIIPWTDFILSVRQNNPHVAIVRGIETTIRALARLFPGHAADQPAEPLAGQAASAAPVGEAEGRRILAGLGLPVVAGYAYSSVDAAVASQDDWHYPAVVKIDVTGVAHKAKLGLVAVGCQTRAEVIGALTAMAERMSVPDGPGEAQPQVAAVLIEDMAAGAEVLIGLHRGELGSFLTIGAGGVQAGAGTAARTMLLPAGPDEVAAACAAVAGSPESPGVASATKAVLTLCGEFESGRLSGYDAVELNPVFVSADDAAIADVLLVCAAESAIGDAAVADAAITAQLS